MKRGRSPDDSSEDEQPIKRQRTKCPIKENLDLYMTPKERRLNEALLDTGLLPACLLPIIHEYADFEFTLLHDSRFANGWTSIASNGQNLFLANSDGCIQRYDFKDKKMHLKQITPLSNIEQLVFDGQGRLFCLSSRQIFELCPTTFAIVDWWCNLDHVFGRILLHSEDQGLVTSDILVTPQGSSGWSTTHQIKYWPCPRERPRSRQCRVMEPPDSLQKMWFGRIAPDTRILHLFDQKDSAVFTGTHWDIAYRTNEVAFSNGHHAGFLYHGRSFDVIDSTLCITNFSTSDVQILDLANKALCPIDIVVEQDLLFILSDTGLLTRRLDIYGPVP